MNVPMSDQPCGDASDSEPLPLLTVLMPVFNGEAYIHEAINSILTQTLQDFEFLIIDDGSTDSTPQILDDLARHDPRVRVVHQENRDHPATLNRGLTLARTDWVAIIDHDDVSMPDRLEKQLKATQQHPTAKVIGTWAYEIGGDGGFIGSVPLGPTSVAEFRSLRAANQWITFVHSSVMLHRPTVLALGGYREEFGSAADSDLWSRVADDHDVISIPKYLVLYRIHLKSMSYQRFFEQQFVVRWIRACQDARRSGKPEPSMSEQRAWENGLLGLRRIRTLRYDWMMNLLRRRRLARFQGQRGLAFSLFIAATLLDPRRAVRSIMRRVRIANSAASAAPQPPEWMRNHPGEADDRSSSPFSSMMMASAVRPGYPSDSRHKRT